MDSEVQWIYPSQDALRIGADLGEHLNVPPALGPQLASRGVETPEACRLFLDPSLADLHDPWLLEDLPEAVDRIMRAVKSKERVLIVGDYDVDGVTATFLLVSYLKRLGAHVGYHIPNRLTEGYGLNSRTVEEAARRGYTLIVTADCGTSSVDEVALAAARNVDVVVTDHHALQPRQPGAVAFVNPRRGDCRYPFKSLAGVGVVVKVVQALLEKVGGIDPSEFVRDHLDVVALGTIADVVPLTGENRIFAKLGIEELRGSNKPGILALRRISGLAERRLEASDISFVLAPRINAAGKLGNPESAVRLLMSSDNQEAEAIAESLEEDNNTRKRMNGEALEEALEMLKEEGADPKRAQVLSSPNWHPGVTGIVAARLVEKFRRPAALISIDGESGRGSSRAGGGFDLCEILEDCKDSLITYGGHSYAAGFSIETRKIPEFSARFREAVDARIEGLDLRPKLALDGRMSLEDCTASFIKLLDRASPFGLGNPEPVLAVEDAHILSPPVLFGRNHLRMIVAQGGHSSECVGFNMGELKEELTNRGDHLNLACSPSLHTWRGTTRLQLKLKDVKFN
jgi:single-stranded-DNA-specific exonuclease